MHMGDDFSQLPSEGWGDRVAPKRSEPVEPAQEKGRPEEPLDERD